MESQQTPTRQRFIKIIILFVFVSLVFTLLSWVYNSSRVTFSAPDDVEGKVKYELVNQGNGEEVIIFESDEKSFTRRVPKAVYEVKITANNKSYFEVLSTKPFLQVSNVDFSLSSERKREFIGNNPESCIYFDGKQAISYSCGNELLYMNSHFPATASTPTYTEAFSEDFDDLLAGGIVKLNNKKILYAQGFNDIESDNVGGLFFEINDSLDILSSLNVTRVNTEEFNQIKKFKDGFILYGTDFEDIKYYRDISNNYESLKIPHPKDKNLTPQSLDVYENKIAATYADSSATQGLDYHSSTPRPGKTVVQIYNSPSDIKELTFKEGFSSVKLCSQDYLCFINAGNLSIYDISGKKQKHLLDLKGVKSAFPAGGKIIIEKEKEIIEIDPESKKGYVQYSFGEYTSCGTNQTELNGYTACIVNNKENGSLVYIDPANENTNSVDKKVLELLKQPFVSDVSAYKSFIYIVPNVGGLVPDPSTGQYIYDPGIRAEAAAAINNFVKEIGLNNSGFNIINTTP